jgi:hypothetical protein
MRTKRYRLSYGKRSRIPLRSLTLQTPISSQKAFISWDVDSDSAAFPIRLAEDAASSLDMEVHERVLTNGKLASLRTPLIHEDFKGLTAYIDRHNKYSSWEADVRYAFLCGLLSGDGGIRPNLFGNHQERRRFLKMIAMRVPFEPQLWFLYHYIARLGFLEGRSGLIASQIRANYISQVRAKLYESRWNQGRNA